MSGKLCFGKEYNNAGAGRLRDSKAFCEGRYNKANGGTALGADNPHVATSDAGLAWAAGFASTDPGCCAA